MRRSILVAVLSVFVATSCSLPGRDRATITPGPTVPGGTLRMAISEPDSLDPSRASNRPALTVMRVLCDTLVSFEPKTGALAPGLAASWTIAPDARSVTFKLADVNFQNGRKLVAQDVVYSVSRFVHPKTGSPEFFFFDRVVGYPDVRQEKTETLAGVKAIDASTVQFDLTEPFAELPAVLAHPSAGAPIPKEEVDKGADAFASRPICTGPYTLAETYVKGSKATLIRSGEYSRASSVYPRNGSGYLNKIEFRIVPNNDAGFDQLKKGELHLAEIPIARLDEARRSSALVSSGTNGHLAYLGMPVTKSPYDKVGVRRALALDIDRTFIIENLLAGTRRIPRGFMPEATGKTSATACPSSVKPRADISGAKSALVSSGIDPSTLKPVVYLNASGGHERWMQPVIDRWGKDLGVTATMKTDEWKKYLDFLVEPGADGPFRLAWAVKYPSPEALLGPMFATGSPDNFTKYASATFQDALGKARATAEAAAREDLYRKALEVLCEDIPIVVMWFGKSHFAASSKLNAKSVIIDVFGDPVIRQMGFPSR